MCKIGQKVEIVNQFIQTGVQTANQGANQGAANQGATRLIFGPICLCHATFVAKAMISRFIHFLRQPWSAVTDSTNNTENPDHRHQDSYSGVRSPYASASIAPDSRSSLKAPGVSPSLQYVPSEALAQKLNSLREQQLTPAQANSLSLQRLRIFAEAPIPKNAKIVLSARVFNGIGDAEHLVRVASCIDRMRHGSANEIKSFALIQRGLEVPDKAWEQKLRELHDLRCDVHLETYEFCSPLVEKNYKSAMKLDRTTCYVEVSAVLGFLHSARENEPQRSILEYGVAWPSDLSTGFGWLECGIWCNDFIPDDSRTSLERWQSISLGMRDMLGISSAEKLADTFIGIAQLRSGAHKSTWLQLQLMQFRQSPAQTCALCLSTKHWISDEELWGVAKQNGFNHLQIIRNDSVQEFRDDSVAGKCLRIVDAFIPEADMLAVLSLASGSIGACGDTSCSKSLTSNTPPFWGEGGKEDSIWRTGASETASFLGLTKLATWFAFMHAENPRLNHYFNTLGQTDYLAELRGEWNRYKTFMVQNKRLETHVENYLRMCLFSTRHEWFAEHEKLFMTGQMTLQEYERRIVQALTEENRSPISPLSRE